MPIILTGIQIMASPLWCNTFVPWLNIGARLGAYGEGSEVSSGPSLGFGGRNGKQQGVWGSGDEVGDFKRENSHESWPFYLLLQPHVGLL